MKKTRLSIYSFGLIAGLAIVGVASVALTQEKVLISSATDSYSCSLPAGYVELGDIIQEAIELGAGNSAETTYSVRGTVTRKVGNTAYIQRVNQGNQELESIAVYGVRGFGGFYPGAVVDILNPTVSNYYGLPQIQFGEFTIVSLAYEQNPFGYDPTSFDGVVDFSANAFANKRHVSAYNYGRYVEVLGAISQYVNEPTAAYTRGNYLYDESSNALPFSIFAENLAEANDIATTLNYAYDNNLKVNVKGVLSLDYGTEVLRILSADDIELVINDPSGPIASHRVAHIYYGYNAGNPISISLPIYRMKGKGEVDYVKVSEGFYDAMAFSCYYDAAYWMPECTVDQNTYRYVNTFGSMVIDVEADTITFNNPGRFLTQTMVAEDLDDAESDGMFLVNGIDTEHIQTLGVHHYAMASASITLDLSDYGIDLIGDGENAFMPLSTCLDTFFSTNLLNMAYNGVDVYYSGALSGQFAGLLDQEENPLEYKFYTESPWFRQTTRSAELAAFNYAELCYGLDLHYGLKEHREVTSFASLFESLGLAEALQSTDVETCEYALASFAGQWLYEGHSGYSKVCPASQGDDNVYSQYATNLALNAKRSQLTNASAAMRSLRNDSGDPSVNEVGLRLYENMAVIRFDSFMKYNGDIDASGLEEDYSTLSYEDLHSIDSYFLFRKAFDEIESYNAGHSEDPIEHVVFDTTTNGGGMVDAIPWLEAFFTEDPNIITRNGLTGEVTEVHYNVDLNRNGVYNEPTDTYKGKFNFFLLTSNYSFSCGTLFPTMAKQNGFMTLIGETSGGGACVVGGFSTAVGTMFRSSSLFQGGTYDSEFHINEDGIVPDYALDRESFFDNAALKAFIEGIVNGNE